MKIITEKQPKVYRKVKCPECELDLFRDTQAFITHSKRHYHEECFNKLQIRKQHRSELLDYICELYKIPIPNGLILKQIKEYETEYKYTLKGIQMSLHYFHIINGNPVEIENSKYNTAKGIGIVPYVYDDAKNYYVKMQMINVSARNTTIQTKAEIVKIKQTKKEKPKNLIEIKGIANEQE